MPIRADIFGPYDSRRPLCPPLQFLSPTAASPTPNDAKNALSDVIAKAADAISEQMDFLNSMHESVTKSMNLNVALE